MIVNTYFLSIKICILLFKILNNQLFVSLKYYLWVLISNLGYHRATANAEIFVTPFFVPRVDFGLV